MTEPHLRHRAAVEAFLRDPNHLATDDGSMFGDPTDQPKLYELAALHGRLLPVLTLLPPAVFQRLARDRNLLIVASPSPGRPWPGPREAIDPVAHGAYAVRGRNLRDPVTLQIERPPGSWLIKLGRIEVELASRQQVFAGIVIHECLHAYLDHDFGARSIDRAAVQRVEDEAVNHACQFGFIRETAAFLNFYATRFPDADVIMGRLPTA
jgi:hypothetical protein